MGAGGKSSGPEPVDASRLQGSGEVEPGSGLPRWVDDPRARKGAEGGITWPDLLEHWGLIEADLADRGIDVEDLALMRARSFRWLRARVLGLMAVPPTGWRDIPDGKRTRSEPQWGTRIQYAINATRQGATA